MTRKTIAIALSALLAATATSGGLALYAMTAMSINELIQCSAGEGGIRLPSAVCEYYMKTYRTDAEDMKALAVGGLDPILNLSNTEKKYELAAFFIQRGLDVDGVNHYHYGRPSDATPLHLSALYNDPERARFLLEHGADVTAISEFHGGRTPLELANQLQQLRPEEDRSRLIRLLSAASATPDR